MSCCGVSRRVLSIIGMCCVFVLSGSGFGDTPWCRRVVLFGSAWCMVVRRGTILVRVLVRVRAFYGL